jgi:phage terminase small subunit
MSTTTPSAAISNGEGNGSKLPSGCTGRGRQSGQSGNARVRRPGDGLTDRQRAFVAAYLSNGFNATRAAMAAGHKCNSYSAFGVQGGEALKNPKVRAAIDAYFRQAGMSADEVVARLVEQATANPAQFFDKRWRVKRAVLESKGHLVRKFKPASRGRPAEIELHDAQAALVLIGKHLGMFSDKVQRIGDQGGPIQNVSSGPVAQPLTASNEPVVIVWPHETAGGNGKAQIKDRDPSELEAGASGSWVQDRGSREN